MAASDFKYDLIQKIRQSTLSLSFRFLMIWVNMPDLHLQSKQLT